MLKEEREFFEQSLPEWLNKYNGKVVLVKGKELIGVFNTEDEALSEGARRFQLQPFLIRRVQPQQAEVSIPALMLGIFTIDANSTFAVQWGNPSA